MKDILQEIREKTLFFWEKEYPSFNQERKMKYWEDILELSFAEQKRAQEPIFSPFNAEWWSANLENEPNLSFIIETLFLEKWKDLSFEEFKENTLQVPSKD
jgi:hypothetical protein